MRWLGPTCTWPRQPVWVLVAALAGAFSVAVAAPADDAAARSRPPFPVGEHLTYNIRYLGIHCGAMTLDSFADPELPGVSHTVLEARTSRFFDGIYRVRVRIEAVYDAARDSSLSYHHHGQEKKDTKDELWQVDFAAGQVRRSRNGEDEAIPFSGGRVLDPLSFLYRMRMLLGAVGDRATLPMMTSDGDVDTVAEVAGERTEKTPFGKREVLIVVPHPAKDELFTKKGRMEIWMGADAERLPYRVIFDLPFGKLVAILVKVEPHSGDRELQSGEEG
jgi:hypothetical protein